MSSRDARPDRSGHGGRTPEAWDGRGAGARLDFSANANAWQPSIPADCWERWRAEMVRYPTPDARGTAARLASAHRLPSEWILATAGGIEAIYLVARLLAGRRVAIVEPAFVDYRRACLAAGARVDPVILTRDRWAGAVGDWADRVRDADAVIVGYPNNPTGTLWERAALLDLVRAGGARAQLWIVDEAFIEFVEGPDERSLTGVLGEHPNLVVLRSLTKSWAVPGLRVGFLAGSCRDRLAALEALQPPWPLCGVAECWVRDCVDVASRDAMLARLRALPGAREEFRAGIASACGARALGASANFFLIETDRSGGGTALAERLEARGIASRRCENFLGMADGRHLRLAVRLPGENARVLEALRLG